MIEYIYSFFSRPLHEEKKQDNKQDYKEDYKQNTKVTSNVQTTENDTNIDAVKSSLDSSNNKGYADGSNLETYLQYMSFDSYDWYAEFYIKKMFKSEFNNDLSQILNLQKAFFGYNDLIEFGLDLDNFQVEQILELE